MNNNSPAPAAKSLAHIVRSLFVLVAFVLVLFLVNDKNKWRSNVSGDNIPVFLICYTNIVTPRQDAIILLRMLIIFVIVQVLGLVA